MQRILNAGKMVFLPVMTFLVFFIITRITGNKTFGDFYTWKMIFINTATTVSMGYVLALNLKSGRMDLSCGANMIASSLLSVYIATSYGLNGWGLLALCILFCVVFSLVTAFVYVTTKMPIIVTTVGMALVYESATRLINGGNGGNVISTSTYNFWGMAPWAYILMGICILAYHIVTQYTIIGHESEALVHNQRLGVSLGINEKRNVIYIFLFSGFLLGICSAMYAATTVMAPQSNFASVGTVFQNLLPVIMGLYLAKYGNDSVGILMGALSVGIIKYGLNLIGWGSALNIVIGLFMIGFSIYTRLDEQSQKKADLLSQKESMA